MPTDVFPLPAGTAVLHIGPHKTGTTAMQHALHLARADLAAQGVRYASARRHDADASRFAIGGRPRHGQRDAERLWVNVVAALNDTSYARRIFSSESLSNATDKAAARIAGELGPIHVVMAARPTAELVPSQYQQLVQRGATTEAFGDWSEAVFGRRPTVDASIFWRRHRLDDQVRRWGELIGYDRVSVVVIDGRDRRFLPATFERLLALTPGTLADRTVNSNRSLSAEETELLRQWHERAVSEGLRAGERRRLSVPLRTQLQSRPDEGAPRLALTPEMVEEANRVAAQIAGGIAASGARVIGDLGALSAVRPPAL